jgi:hypothetical protein
MFTKHTLQEQAGLNPLSFAYDTQGRLMRVVSGQWTAGQIQ